MLIFGTRPEIIKLYPLIIAMKSDPDLAPIICSTGQHRELILPMLKLFEIKPDLNLNLMAQEPNLSALTSIAIDKIARKIKLLSPDLTIVHGDTATTLAAAIASYQNKTPIAHVEAGLRTNNILSPWPEEGNRRMVSAISSLHFAPTLTNFNNLIAEGISRKKCFVTGNTVIDAVQHMYNKITTDVNLKKNLSIKFNFINTKLHLILITVHRRENFGSYIKEICNAIKELAFARSDCEFVYPVHLNPNIVNPVRQILSNIKNVHLINPVNYEEFVFLMGRSYFIITDSGGIQEEGSALSKPILLLRENTERPEAVEAGSVKLVGTKRSNIVKQVVRLLDDTNKVLEMTSKKSPFGDGTASQSILIHLKNFMRAL